jgi:hypothetical protein
MIDVAAAAAQLNLTHLAVMGKRNAEAMPRLLEMIDRAADEGLGVTFCAVRVEPNILLAIKATFYLGDEEGDAISERPLAFVDEPTGSAEREAP